MIVESQYVIPSGDSVPDLPVLVRTLSEESPSLAGDKTAPSAHHQQRDPSPAAQRREGLGTHQGVSGGRKLVGLKHPVRFSLAVVQSLFQEPGERTTGEGEGG